MLKSTLRSCVILFSSLAWLLTVSQSANAGNPGLNVGAKIPPGQERQLLQYQLQNDGKGLRQLRVIPDCVVGFGLGCNKTGTVLEQIIQSNGGPTYQQMLERAAGGGTNYQKFASFYGANPNPYASVWRGFNRGILDSAQYSLGANLSSNPVPGLRDVTKNFLWSSQPASDPRSAFINFKMAYVKDLLEETSKIPNLEQQIRQLNLEPGMERFYLNNIEKGLNALRSGDNGEFKQASLNILSRPYSPVSTDDGWYGRELVEIPDGLVQTGETLVPDLLTDAVIEPSGLEGTEEIAQLPGEEVLLAAPGTTSFLLPALALLALAGLLISLGGGDSSDSSSVTTSNIPNPQPTNPQPTNPPTSICDTSGGVVPGSTPGVVVCDTPTVPTPPEVRRVVEPSTMNAIIWLALIICLVSYKRRCVQTKS
ncbi:hypothetical protein [Nostoc sp. TCL26-01]|uniref:hypothetical protein n=1 Tax=Nostoc sp. TCL26-01 TaxID=2576904 RepID=UPI0015C0873C|nr:hypothetical protein [Nostoc sp. TCL26-01]QLE59058.1 hypothetical protein FD725_28315 [Nostoc sp. TCL26-01]